MELIIQIISAVYNFLWGDLFAIPLPGGGSAGISLLVLLLIPTGIYFTIRTRVLPIRLFPEMLRLTVEKRTGERGNAISGLQTLIVSTATRVGMGNLVGVVAAISAGGAGAVFWMWISALLGSSTAFVEATLAQLYKEKDPLYGGYRGGPAYYIHAFVQRKLGGKKRRYSLVAVLFAISGLICWCGISQVISNSVSSAFENAFQVPPLYSTLLLVILAAVIVLRKNATVKVLDVLVPVMAGCYFLLTVVLVVKNAALLPSVFQRIFEEAFGLRQVVAGGFGAVLMNGVKRGLFSNEDSSRQGRTAAGVRGVHRHHRHLQLHGADHAGDAGGEYRGPAGHGSASGVHAVSSGSIRRGVHCPGAVAVQLFHVHWHFVLCPVQCGLSVRRQLGVPDRL